MGDKISVLIVDDSALMRKLISNFFSDLQDIEVAGRAMNGRIALRKIEELKPDIIVLDLEMPEMNGIDFLKERNKRGIGIPVIILSSLASKGARITMQALSLGASDFILKPSGIEKEGISHTQEHLIQLIRVYGWSYRRKRTSADRQDQAESPKTVIKPEKKATTPASTPKKNIGSVEIVAIGISTGGPNALRQIVPELNKTLSSPILIVQHMPPGFTAEFAASLNKNCPLEVKEANEGDIIKPGRILIAPGDRHITIDSKELASVVRLSDAPLVNGHRPSADILFAEVCRNYQNRCMAIIMTGMGKDGAKEIGSIYEAGGLTLAQDESSCIVFGMPRVAIENGFIHEIVPLNKIAAKINDYCPSPYIPG